MDNEEYRICPYDSQHKVRSSRFEIHLSKCAKHYVKKLYTCPFHSKHVFTSQAMLNNHILTCTDNKRLNYELKLNQIMDEAYAKEPVAVSSSNLDIIKNEEDWDAEIKPPSNPSTIQPPSVGLCYANMTRKQRKELNKQQLEAFSKTYNPK